MQVKEIASLSGEVGLLAKKLYWLNGLNKEWWSAYGEDNFYFLLVVAEAAIVQYAPFSCLRPKEFPDKEEENTEKISS